jgi:hypothetical protein
MKKLTLFLDDRNAAWALKQASRQKKSVSRFVGLLLLQDRRETQKRAREARKRGREYQESMYGYLSRGPFVIEGPRQRYPSRQELYDPPLLRRR